MRTVRESSYPSSPSDSASFVHKWDADDNLHVESICNDLHGLFGCPHRALLCGLEHASANARGLLVEVIVYFSSERSDEQISSAARLAITARAVLRRIGIAIVVVVGTTRHSYQEANALLDVPPMALASEDVGSCSTEQAVAISDHRSLFVSVAVDVEVILLLKVVQRPAPFPVTLSRICLRGGQAGLLVLLTGFEILRRSLGCLKRNLLHEKLVDITVGFLAGSGFLLGIERLALDARKTLQTVYTKRKRRPEELVAYATSLASGVELACLLVLLDILFVMG